MFVLERRRREQAVNQFWNVTVTGGTASEAPIDPALVNLIRQLHATDSAQVPGNDFVNQLESRLVDQLRQTSSTGVRVPATFPRTGRIGRVLRGSSPAIGERSRAALSRLAAQAAMAILLIIIAGSVAVIYFVENDESANKSSIPAVAPDEDRGNSEDQTRTETLLNVTIDPTSLGLKDRSNWTSTSLEFGGLEPGKEFVLCDIRTCDTGLVFFYVLDGQLTLEALGPAMVIRSDAGSTEPQPADIGGEVRLNPGDAVALSAFSLSHLRNDSSTRVNFLKQFTGSPAPDAVAQGMAEKNPPFVLRAAATDWNLLQRFEGPVSLTVERITIGAGAWSAVETFEGETLLAISPDDMFKVDNGDQTTTVSDIVLHDYPPGTHQLGATTNGPVEIFLARMSPA
jgi:hypothetical protein